MGINKIVYDGTTLIDLTGDTATAADVAQGKTFHLNSGVQAVGTNTGGGSAQHIYCGQSAPLSSIGDNGDLYMLLSSGGSLETYPADLTYQNINSASHLSDCIGVSAEDGTSTSNVYSSGSSVTGIVDYTFDLSSIPSGVGIQSVSLTVKAHEENASRSTCTVRLYAGSTAKGSLTTVSGTSNAIYDVDCGSWTRAELDELTMRLSLGYYGGLIAGATLNIEYEVQDPQFNVELVGTASGWSVSGSNMYMKSGGSWSAVSSAELDDAISRA